MPVLTSLEISSKFKEKWMMLHLEDKANVNGSVHFDDSLTSLQWLQDFSILSANLESLPSSTCHPPHLPHKHPQGTDSPASPPAGDTAATGIPHSSGSLIPSSASANRSGSSYLFQQQLTSQAHHNHITVSSCLPEEIDYKTNHQAKPPYSYATLICMAMQASKKTKVTLSAIYNWITENFCYYRHAEPSWQNSIRHNLSLNKCFMKVPRQKDEPGKGGFWQIDPQYADMFVNGVFKRRRMPAAHFNTQRQSKVPAMPGLSSNGSQADRSHRGIGVGRKRNQRGPKWAKVTKSPLLAAEAKETEPLDWALVLDDVLKGSSSNFEDLDLNAALDSLGCEVDLSPQGWHLAGRGKWCMAGADHTTRYMEMSDTVGCSVEEIQQQLNTLQQPFPQAPPQHFEELTLFSDQQFHPWEELKEEMQAVPISLGHGFSFYDGFFTETQPWERADSYP